MKSWATSFQVLAVFFAACLLASCQAPPLRKIIFEDQMTQLQARSIQSRAFDMTDQIKAMRAVITTLQDLDFVIDQADSRLGIITATKLQIYHLYITVKVDELKSGWIRVRVQLRAGINPLVEAVYQEFFTSLEKNFFLTAHYVPIPKSFAPGEFSGLTEKSAPTVKKESQAFQSAAISTVQVDENEPWTGTWKVKGSQLGDMVFKLKQSGNKVKSIRGSSYELKAKVNGDRLKGWYEGPAGLYIQINLKIDTDRITFNGTEFNVKTGTLRLKGERQE
jgi:hypothetical protein